MAKDLSGTTAATQKILDHVKVVYLVELDADEPDVGTSTQYWASRAFTLDGQAYEDVFKPSGIAPGWTRLRPAGGLAAVGGMSLSVANEAKASNLIDTYYIENDQVRLYVVYLTGSEDAGDKIELFRGVVDEAPFSIRDWRLSIIDDSDKDFREVPADSVHLIDYPDASLDALGKVIPVAFGALNVGPADGAGAFPLLATCRNLDVFALEYTSGLNNDVFGDAYQWYGPARRLARVVNITTSGGKFTIDDPMREMVLEPVLPMGTNDVSGWSAAADGNGATGIAVGAGSNMDLRVGGTSKLGTLTTVTGIIAHAGTISYAWYLEDPAGGAPSLLASGSGAGDQSDDLGIANWADDWDFERVYVSVDGAADLSVSRTYVQLGYLDQTSMAGEQLPTFQKVTGWEDSAAHYRDGAVIDSDGAPLTNPAHVLEAVLRGRNLMDLGVASVNSTAVGVAATARTGWAFAFTMDEAVSIGWLNEYAFQMGSHLFKDFQGRWKMVARDETAAPSHTFLGDHHVAVRNPDADPGGWEYDCRFARTPMRSLVNELNLRYRLDRATGQYTAAKTASGHHRVSGTCAVSGGPTYGTLTDDDGARDFTADGVQDGESVYVAGDQDYTVLTGGVGTTTLSIEAEVGDVNSSSAGTDFYVGPNLDGRMKRSQLRYKTENSLARRRSSHVETGGYMSDLIADATTAENLVEHLIEWRSQRRVSVEFATFHNAVDVELGDLAWFDHPWLPPSRRPRAAGALDEALTDSGTTLVPTVAGMIREDDYLLVGGVEVVLVTAMDYGLEEGTITRGQCNTTAVAHAIGATLKTMNRTRFEVVGVKPQPLQGQFRLQLEETPSSYLPTGIVSAATHVGWAAATAEEKATSGWSTYINGLVAMDDEFSNVSYTGPDTGTY